MRSPMDRRCVSTLALILVAACGGPASPAKDATLPSCGPSGADRCTQEGIALLEAPRSKRDLQGAAALFARACDAGSAEGCRRLGLAKQSGAGVAADPVAGLGLLTQACE